MFKDHVRTRQRRMPAQLDLGHRREPAQRKGILAGNEKRGFGKIIFQRNGLHQRVIQPAGERHDGSGIAFEHATCKRVDLVLCEQHADPVPGTDDTLCTGLSGT
jgi:hypothetical protein